MRKHFHVYSYLNTFYGVRRKDDNIIETFTLHDSNTLSDFYNVEKCEIVSPLKIQHYLTKHFDLDKHRANLFAYLITKDSPMTISDFRFVFNYVKDAYYVMGILLDE